MFCPKCGAQSDEGKFCRACGTNLAVVSNALSGSRVTQRKIEAQGAKTALGIFHTAFLSNEDHDLNGHSGGTVFGTLTVDLTAAPLPAGETKINIFSIFGTAEVLVPDNVALRVTGVTIFSNCKVRGEEMGNGIVTTNDYISPGYDQAPRRLHIDATSVFSTVRIRR